jgi:hypothetical protein
VVGWGETLGTVTTLALRGGVLYGLVPQRPANWGRLGAPRTQPHRRAARIGARGHDRKDAYLYRAPAGFDRPAGVFYLGHGVEVFNG